MDTVTISLNGKEVAGPSGTTILEVASQVGVHIPTLCHHPLLKSVGACRICLVEESRSGRLLASCVTPIAEGMEILTHSKKAIDARRGVLELILSDHPSACVICSKGNECVLRALAKDHGICDPDLEPIRRWRSMEEVNPFIVRDLTKCVMCGRCIRVCKDYEATGAIEYTDRGYATHPGTAHGTPLEGSECNFCGSCVTICPTDALAERNRIFHGSGKDFAPGICSFCGTGCRLEYAVRDGALVGARGTDDSPMNGISLCVRGHYGQDALSNGRLTEPLIRREDGELHPASWGEALDLAAARLKHTIELHGPETVGIITGTNCSNEELYLAVRFARAVARTPHVDSIARLSSATVMEGLTASYQGPRRPSVGDIEDAETIVLVAARPDYTHPVVARNVRRAVRNRGADLIQLDSLTTSLSRFARLHVKNGVEQLPPFLKALMKELVARNLHDEKFLRAGIKNADEFINRLKPPPGEKSSSEEVKQAARLMGRGRKIFILIGPMLARVTQGYILARLAADLAFLCGQPERVLFLGEGTNEKGVWDLGCAPDRLPGACRLGDSGMLEILKGLWGPDIVQRPGLDAMGMLRDAEKGRLKALVLMGADPLAVFPDTERTRKALARVDLIIRTGMFPATIYETAGIVFPSTAITEADGTYMNMEGRVQRMGKVANPPGDARPTARFLLDLAGLLGYPMGFVTARDIFDEIRRVCPTWEPLRWEDVGKSGGRKPLAPEGAGSSEERGEPRQRLVPYTPPDSFATPPAPPLERPFRVHPEERMLHPGDGVLSARSNRLTTAGQSSLIRIHPEDAALVGAKKGSLVMLRSDVGEATARADLDSNVPRSGVAVPSGGPDYILQRLLPWPEEYCPPCWDRVFVSLRTLEE